MLKTSSTYIHTVRTYGSYAILRLVDYVESLTREVCTPRHMFGVLVVVQKRRHRVYRVYD